MTLHHLPKPAHPAKAVIAETISQLARIVPTRVFGEADTADCLAIAGNFKDLKNDAVMPLVKAFAEYAQEATGVDLRTFIGLIDDAFEDAIGALEKQGDELSESRAEEMGEVIRRGRGWYR
jgi:hypothetical protein